MSMLTDAFKTLEQIGSTSKRTDKELLLSKGKHDEFLLTLLKYTYNPFKIYYLKKVPPVSPVAPVGDDKILTAKNEVNRFKLFIKMLDRLSSREITGNAALEVVTQLMINCTADEIKWFTKVIQKDLKIGITEKTLNKVYGKGFVPTYGCMLADKMNKLSDLPSEYYVEPKLDGMRIQAFVYSNTNVVLKSRNGKVVEGYDELEYQLKEYMEPGYVYDGEIMAKNIQACSEDGNKTGAGFNQLMTQAFAKTSNKLGVLNMFDCIKIEVFEQEGDDIPQIERKLRLKKFYDQVPVIVDSSALAVVPHMGVFHKDNDTDVQALYKMHDKFIKDGYEGLMVKDITMPYIYKRTKRLLKLKPMDDFDLEVIDLEEGSGKYEGMLGAAVVDFNGFEVHVGSGFTDEERITYWSNKQSLVGKTIQVQAQEVTVNKAGTQSLRFPTYKGVRLDK